MIRSAHAGRIVRSDQILEVNVRDITTDPASDRVGIFGRLADGPDVVLWLSDRVALRDGSRTEFRMEQLRMHRSFARVLARVVAEELVTGAASPVVTYDGHSAEDVAA